MAEVSIQYSITDTKKEVNTAALERDLTGVRTFEDFADSFKKFHISTAIEVLDSEQRRGFDKNPRQRIDNVFDRPLRNLKPFGKVEYFAKIDVEESIMGIFQFIIERSPIDTGIYKQSNLVFFNGEFAGDSEADLQRFVRKKKVDKGFKEGDTFLFVNTTPYARKLEYLGVRRETQGRRKGLNTFSNPRSGKKIRGGRRVSFKKPTGAYFLSYRRARAKFKSIANQITFKFLPGNNNLFQIVSNGRFRTTFKVRNNASKRDQGRQGRPYLYPTIKVVLSEKGLKGAGGSNVV